MNRRELENLETGIKRDRKSKELVADTKVKIGTEFQKIRRHFPGIKESLNAARVWRVTVKDQHKRKHPTLRLRTNGTWVVDLPSTEKFPPLSRDFGYDFDSAQDWAKQTFDERQKGRWQDEEKNLQSVWECYLSDGTSRIKEATLFRYRQIWDKDLSDYWGDKLASDVHTKDVQRWIDDWSGSIPKLDHARRVLSIVFKHAVDEGVMNYNPCSRRTLPERQTPKSFALTVEQIKTLRSHPARRSDRLGLNLALETGLRWSEWSPLRVKDLNLEGGMVTVSRHWTQDSKGRKVLLEGHKTGLDPKTANISEPLAQALKDYIQEMGLESEDLIFPAPKGGLMSYNNYRNRIWEPARLAAGIKAIPYKTGTHTTKRTAITQAHEAGLSDATIIGQTKHSNTKIIHDSYIQTSELAGKIVADKIYERLGIVD